MFDPNKWFALLCAAQRRNEDPIREKYKDRGSKRDIWEIGEALEFAHNAAVEAAAIAAEEAYISAFHAHYDRAHEETYNRLAPPSLKVRYKRGGVKPRKTFAGINPYGWCELMHNALNRNEELVWNALKPLFNKDLAVVDELLVRTHITAVEAANLAAETAYIKTFNATYDKQHRKTYQFMIFASGVAEILPLVNKRSKGQQDKRSDAKTQ